MKSLGFLIRSIFFILGIALGLYLLLCMLLWIFQGKLLFFPSSPYIPHYEKISQDGGLRNYKLTTMDGHILDGWMQIQPSNKKTILYFGGNGDEVSYFAEKYKFKNINIITFNYRGYGYSTGKPSEEYLFRDAHQIYKFLIDELKISPGNLYVMGRSLGTGIATYIASEEKFAGVILVTPYDSVENIAKGGYWFIPVSLLLRNKFRSYEYAQIQENRILSIYGGNDHTIPKAHTENLLEYWNGPIERIFVPEANHDNIYSFSEVQKAIERFVK